MFLAEKEKEKEKEKGIGDYALDEEIMEEDIEKMVETKKQQGNDQKHN